MVDPSSASASSEVADSLTADTDATIAAAAAGKRLDADDTKTAVEMQTERLEGGRRRLSAALELSHPVEHVWQVLTDYDNLANFIPNLAESRRIEHPEGGIRLEQVGTESLLKLKVCLRVVLDMVEHFPHTIEFNMVEGNFREFFGAWELAPVATPTPTRLRYVVTVLPERAMPVGLIERNLRHNLIRNLLAIQQQVDQTFGAR